MYISREYKIGTKEKINIANNFIHDYYGQFLYASEMNNNSFFINASLPYEIIDNNKRILRFDEYNHIAEIKVDINDKLMKFTGLNSSNIEKSIENAKSGKIKKSEKSLFKISSTKFTELPAASVFYMPIKEIITKVYNKGYMDIENRASNNKLIKYAKFLEQLEIIKISVDDETYKFSIGEQTRLIEISSENPVMALFNYSITHGYDYLYNNMGIRSLSSYLKIANSFYYNITKLGKNITVNENELNEYYNNMYRTKMKDYTFSIYLENLFTVKLIDKTNDIVTGNKEITEQLLEA
jgi:hypothetical protein